MPRRTIQLDNRIYSCSHLMIRRTPCGSVSGRIEVRVTDELTGAAPNSRTRSRSKSGDFFSRLGSDGLGGLVGLPRQVFPALQARDYPVHLTIDAARYERRDHREGCSSGSQLPGRIHACRSSISHLHRESGLHCRANRALDQQCQHAVTGCADHRDGHMANAAVGQCLDPSRSAEYCFAGAASVCRSRGLDAVAGAAGFDAGHRRRQSADG